jgi:hypothetical protein
MACQHKSANSLSARQVAEPSADALPCRIKVMVFGTEPPLLLGGSRRGPAMVGLHIQATGLFPALIDQSDFRSPDEP